VIQDKVDLLLERLKGFRDNGDVLMASWAFAAFTNGELWLYKMICRKANWKNRYRDVVLLWKV